MSAWDNLRDALGIDPKVRRYFDERFSDGDGGNPSLKGQTFDRGACYFSIRLMEMFLEQRERYLTEYLPLGICIAEFTRNGEKQRVPLVLSSEQIRAKLAGNGEDPGFVQFKNMYVVRDVPFKADNLALFVGLFRVPYNDLAKEVLEFAANVTSELGGAALAGGLKIADKIYDGVSGLLRVNNVQPRFGYMDGSALTRGEYLVVANGAPPGLTPGSLSIVGDRLQIGKGPTAQRAKGFDYCLVALEHAGSLFERDKSSIAGLASLPFDHLWRDVLKQLALQKPQEAAQALLGLRAAVVTSMDLIDEDRFTALVAYSNAYAKFQQQLMPDSMPASPGTRAASSAPTVEALKAEAQTQCDSGQKDVAQVLDFMALSQRMVSPGPPPDPDHPEGTVLAEATRLREELKRRGIMPTLATTARLDEALTLAANGR